ncbi:MAG: ATP-grasp domain-containing protein [Gemmatales bacterium]|nr:ATP-grasp domain-containing protein [Gemmatales bacterium]MDW8386510.1 ATP-grasp domain-containing protein [Gemmatales bacterium]
MKPHKFAGTLRAMKIFLYEYASAQPADVDLPPSIRREGRAMLDAVVEDFAKLPGVEVLTMPSDHGDARTVFQTLAAQADGSLVIAPEFDDLLTTRCQWVEEAGGKLLGPSSSAIAFLSDKWNLYECLTAWGVPTPRTFLPPDTASGGRQPSGATQNTPSRGRQPSGAATASGGCQAPGTPPHILKPRRGAGSVGVHRLHHSDPDAFPGPRLLQEFVAGLPASCALLVSRNGQAFRFPAARQFLGGDTGFRYEGGELPLAEPLDRRVARLLEPLIPRLTALPGVKGYLGVDLILGEAADGSGDVVIEINPRLTTSYLGLRKLARCPLAEAMLAAAHGHTLPNLSWKPGRVRFDARGPVEHRPIGPPAAEDSTITERRCPRS